MSNSDAPLDAGITRRDFVGSTLVGAGTALLHGCAPADRKRVADPWSGPGGIGDYARSNGNTDAVVRAAHGIRDAAYANRLAAATDSGERFDVVIVGGGFGGLGALLECRTQWPGARVLLLDNQAMIGGYAKANHFEVDGYRIAGAQASMNFLAPETPADRAWSHFDRLGLPDRFPFVGPEGGNPAIVFQRSTSGSLYFGEQAATTGYRLGGPFARDIWADDLARAGLDAASKRALLTLRDLKRKGKPVGEAAARFDAMTFADYATRELGATPAALAYVTDGMCQTGPQISALAAMSLPGIDRYVPGTPGSARADRFIAFPDGNATLARLFVKAAIPEALPGPATPAGVSAANIDAKALDQPGAPCRIRLGALAVRIAHEEPADRSSGVSIVYAKDGALHRLRARAAVMAVGHWVGKHIVADLPAGNRAAADAFHYAPMLVANVALRNWRFLDRMGISAMRWAGGRLGFYASIRQPMALGERPAPFHPDKPIVMTFYVPFPRPDLPLEAQGPAGRAALLGTPFATYERLLLAQMADLFAASGFDAARDVAGIVLNRWGHAFVSPAPGFLLGSDGAPSPLQAVVAPFGRIAFAQTGMEDWSGAANAGKRAIRQLAAVL